MLDAGLAHKNEREALIETMKLQSDGLEMGKHWPKEQIEEKLAANVKILYWTVGVCCIPVLSLLDICRLMLASTTCHWMLYIRNS